MHPQLMFCMVSLPKLICHTRKQYTYISCINLKVLLVCCIFLAVLEKRFCNFGINITYHSFININLENAVILSLFYAYVIFVRQQHLYMSNVFLFKCCCFYLGVGAGVRSQLSG